MQSGIIVDYVLVAIVCAVTGGLIGRKAERGLSGFLAGLVLGVIGLAITAMAVALSTEARERVKVKRAAERLRIQRSAQAMVDGPAEEPLVPFGETSR